MKYCTTILLAYSFVVPGPAAAYAQEPGTIEVRNWPAPLFWGAAPGTAARRAGKTRIAFDDGFSVRTDIDGMDQRSAVREATTVKDAGERAASGDDRSGPLPMVAVEPCRLVDTRNPNGAFGGPFLTAGTTRTFPIPQQAACGIPSSAEAYSLNITVVPRGPLPFITVFPTGTSQPTVSTLNSFDGSIVANAAIVPAGTNGAITVFAAGSTDVIIDINGYFQSTTRNNARYINATNSISSSGTTGTRITPNVRDFDPAGQVTTGPDWRFTAERQGIYLVMARVRFPTTFSSTAQLTVYLQPATGARVLLSQATLEAQTLSIATQASLNRGDSVYAEVRQVSGAAVTLFDGAFEAIYLGN